MRNFTVNEIAEKIRYEHEPLKKAADRVRNWTREGLLTIAGESHPGTGRARHYKHDAMLEAGLMQMLTDSTAMPVAGAGPTLRAIKKIVIDEWRAAGAYEPGPPMDRYYTLEGQPGHNTADRQILVISQSFGRKGMAICGMQHQKIQEHLMPERYLTHTIIDLQVMFQRLLHPLDAPFPSPEMVARASQATNDEEI
jgi:hypothetical protein